MFWRCSMAFISMLCLQIYYGLLLRVTKNFRKSIYQELKKDWNVAVWSIVVKDH